MGGGRGWGNRGRGVTEGGSWWWWMTFVSLSLANNLTCTAHSTEWRKVRVQCITKSVLHGLFREVEWKWKTKSYGNSSMADVMDAKTMELLHLHCLQSLCRFICTVNTHTHGHNTYWVLRADAVLRIIHVYTNTIQYCTVHGQTANVMHEIWEMRCFNISLIYSVWVFGRRRRRLQLLLLLSIVWNLYGKWWGYFSCPQLTSPIPLIYIDAPLQPFKML